MSSRKRLCLSRKRGRESPQEEEFDVSDDFTDKAAPVFRLPKKLRNSKPQLSKSRKSSMVESDKPEIARISEPKDPNDQVVAPNTSQQDQHVQPEDKTVAQKDDDLQVIEKVLCSESEKLCPSCKVIVPAALFADHFKECLQKFKLAKKGPESKVPSMPSKEQDTSDQEETPVVLPCPVCKKPFKSKAQRVSHVKACSQLHGLTSEQLLLAARLLEKQTEEWSELGLPTTFHLPNTRSKYFQTSQTAKSKRELKDPDIAMAVALSRSIAEEEAESRTSREEQLLALGMEDIVNEERNVKPLVLLPPDPALTKQLKRGRKNRKGSFQSFKTPLVTRSTEERERLISEKVAAMLSGVDNTRVGWSKNGTATHSKELTPLVDESCHVWAAARSGSEEPLNSYYVPELQPYIHPKETVIGSLFKQLSQIPGRLNTTTMHAVDEESESECEAEEIPNEEFCTQMALMELMGSQDEENTPSQTQWQHTEEPMQSQGFLLPSQTAQTQQENRLDTTSKDNPDSPILVVNCCDDSSTNTEEHSHSRNRSDGSPLAEGTLVHENTATDSSAKQDNADHHADSHVTDGNCESTCASNSEAKSISLNEEREAVTQDRTKTHRSTRTSKSEAKSNNPNVGKAVIRDRTKTRNVSMLCNEPKCLVIDISQSKKREHNTEFTSSKRAVSDQEKLSESCTSNRNKDHEGNSHNKNRGSGDRNTTVEYNSDEEVLEAIPVHSSQCGKDRINPSCRKQSLNPHTKSTVYQDVEEEVLVSSRVHSSQYMKDKGNASCSKESSTVHARNNVCRKREEKVLVPSPVRSSQYIEDVINTFCSKESLTTHARNNAGRDGEEDIKSLSQTRTQTRDEVIATTWKEGEATKDNMPHSHSVSMVRTLIQDWKHILESGSGSDVTITTSDGFSMAAHSLVLLTRCPQLYLESGKCKGVINWDKIPSKTARHFLSYLYTGACEVTTPGNPLWMELYDLALQYNCCDLVSYMELIYKANRSPVKVTRLDSEADEEDIKNQLGYGVDAAASCTEIGKRESPLKIPLVNLDEDCEQSNSPSSSTCDSSSKLSTTDRVKTLKPTRLFRDKEKANSIPGDDKASETASSLIPKGQDRSDCIQRDVVNQSPDLFDESLRLPSCTTTTTKASCTTTLRITVSHPPITPISRNATHTVVQSQHRDQGKLRDILSKTQSPRLLTEDKEMRTREYEDVLKQNILHPFSPPLPPDRCEVIDDNNDDGDVHSCPALSPQPDRCEVIDGNSDDGDVSCPASSPQPDRRKVIDGNSDDGDVSCPASSLQPDRCEVIDGNSDDGDVSCPASSPQPDRCDEVECIDDGADDVIDTRDSDGHANQTNPPNIDDHQMKNRTKRTVCVGHEDEDSMDSHIHHISTIWDDCGVKNVSKNTAKRTDWVDNEDEDSMDTHNHHISTIWDDFPEKNVCKDSEKRTNCIDDEDEDSMDTYNHHISTLWDDCEVKMSKDTAKSPDRTDGENEDSLDAHEHYISNIWDDFDGGDSHMMFGEGCPDPLDKPTSSARKENKGNDELSTSHSAKPLVASTPLIRHLNTPRKGISSSRLQSSKPGIVHTSNASPQADGMESLEGQPSDETLVSMAAAIEEWNDDDLHLSANRNQSSSSTPAPPPRTSISKRQQVTPQPDYTNMKSPQLKEELQKYGICTLGRRKAVTVLQHIYEQTHPLVTDSEAETSFADTPHRNTQKQDMCKQVAQSRDTLKPQQPEDRRRRRQDTSEREQKSSKRIPKGGVTRKGVTAVNEMQDDGKEEEEEESEESVLNSSLSSTSSTDSTGYLLWETVSLPKEENNIPSTQKGDLASQVREMITSDSDMHRKVLLYEPIFVEDLHAALKANKIKCSVQALLCVLDDLCVIVRSQTNQNRGQTKASKKRKKTSPCKKK